MHAGVYNYEFHCNLPAELPTSMEGDTGHIRYLTRVVVDIPMWLDARFEEIFTVIKQLDLNSDPALRVC